ncbi:hypothetical protein ACEPAF_5628 [Sanghuangporus sanghuang]
MITTFVSSSDWINKQLNVFTSSVAGLARLLDPTLGITSSRKIERISWIYFFKFLMDVDAPEVRLTKEVAETKENICFLSKIPVELIENILTLIGRPRDILSFALASKACYNTALTLMYHYVDWTIGPIYPRLREAALRSAQFLREHPSLLAATRVLRVSERKFVRINDTKLFLDYSYNEAPVQPARKVWHRNGPSLQAQNRSFPETFQATNVVLKLLPRFTGLIELTLRSITLPRTFYQSLHALSSSQLRRLTIRHCRLSTRYPAGYDPSQLQLTELTVFHVHSRLAKLKSLIKLARSHSLRILRLDRSMGRALGSLIANGLPPSVHTLELDWRANGQPSRRCCELLFFFLNNCRYVRHIELTDMGKLDSFDSYPANKRLKPNALPSLTSIAVPVPYLEMLLMGRAIDSITITDTTLRETSTMSPMLKFLTVDEISDVLNTLQRASISLQSLKFNLRTWDKELFYMLARKQSKLKELHVAYQYGEVDDAFYMTLGNQIEFPHLERLHLYRFGDTMAGGEDDRFIDQKEYMIIWQLYMPNLCEVALSPDIIWSRSPAVPHAPGGRKVKRTWSRYAVEAMDGVEGLIVVPCPKEARKYEAAGRDRQNPRQFVNAFPNVHFMTHLHPPNNAVHEVVPEDFTGGEDVGFH